MMAVVSGNAWATDWCGDADTQMCITFDDNTVSDLSQNTSSIATTGTPTLTSDSSNPATYSSYYSTFPGTDDYYIVTDTDSDMSYENVSEDFSIALWVDPDTTGAYQQYLAYGDDNDDFWRVVMWNDADFRISLDAQDMEATTNVSLGWEHRAASVDRDGNITFYVNGTPDGTAAAGSETLDITDNRLFIGASISASQDYNGDMDEILVYTGLLDSTDISDIYLNGISQTDTAATEKIQLRGTITVRGNIDLWG